MWRIGVVGFHSSNTATPLALSFSGHSSNSCHSSSLKSNRLAAHPMFILNTNITNISNDVDSIRVIRQRHWRYLSLVIRQIRAITSLWSVGLRQISCPLKSNRLAAHPMFILNTNITNISNDVDSIRVIRQRHWRYLSLVIRSIREIRVRKRTNAWKSH